MLIQFSIAVKIIPAAEIENGKWFQNQQSNELNQCAYLPSSNGLSNYMLLTIDFLELE